MIAGRSGPRGVLWDIGNVVVAWDPRRVYETIFADRDEMERFLAEVCTSEWHLQHDLGAPMAASTAALADSRPEYRDAILAWAGRWPEMFLGPISQSVAVIEAMADRGVPMFGLTNAPPGCLEDNFKVHAPCLSRLADIVVSSEEGVAKPDPRIFEIICARAGLEPTDLLFIDDTLKNVEVAKALGFHAHHFADPDALAPALQEYGFL